MVGPNKTVDQNLLPVQAYFAVDGTFQTFIGQGQPFTATISPTQSGLTITNSTLDSSPIGATTPSTGAFTSISTTTGTITTAPISSSDIVNKLYVDSLALGLAFKNPALLATTANITLSGLQTIDGVTTVAGDRVLVKNQTNNADNGIYNANAGAWTRTTDANTYDQLVSAVVFIEEGSTNSGGGYYCSAQPGGTLGVTAIPWSNLSLSGSYAAGTGLTLTGFTFSITPVGTAGTYGTASTTPYITTNSSGQVTTITNTSIAISAAQITSGTIASSRISGSYTGITGVGTLTAGTWNASTIAVAYGGTGASTLTGYVYGNGTGAMTAATTIPTTALSGTITNAQLANSTISGVALGGNLFTLTIGSNLSGTSYNGSSAVTITNTAPMVYPASGIPNSTGSTWGSSYSTSGSGSVLALATGASLANPTVSNYATFTPQSSLPNYAQGELFYDQAQDALAYYNGVTNNELHIGQEIQLKVYNNTGSTINVGQPVYITSTSSGFIYPCVALAIANSLTTANVIGLANQAIPTGTAGYVTTIGVVSGVNTGTYTVGDTLYLSPYSAGYYQNTIPPTGYAVKIGTVSYVNSSGQIYVNKSNLSVQSGNIVGQVAITNGGTNGTATPTAGAVAYGTGTAYGFTAAGTSGQVLQSNGSSAPSWVSPTAYATVTDDTTTNGTRYPLFANQTAGNLSTEYTSSTKLQFNPSTGVFTATQFSGSGAGLTSIPNSALNNSSVTVGTTAISLGSSATTIAGLVSVTSTTFVGALTGNASSATTATTATNATNIAITDNTSTNATYYPVFVSNSSGNNPATTSSTKLKYNPSTGALYVSAIYIAP